MTAMVRRLIACTAVGGLALAISVSPTNAQDKKEDKVPAISEIMKKGHGGKGLIKRIPANIKEGKWDDVQSDAKQLKEFGEGLGKNTPPKGGDESWKKLTDAYKDNTKAVYDAADKKEEQAVKDGLKKITDSCKGCHSNHK